jgi:hypothetical protein
MWRLRLFAVRSAAEAGRDAGSFQIVVSSMRSWSRARSISTLPGIGGTASAQLGLVADARRLFRDVRADPRRLVGTRLRVRGFIQGRQRPTIDVIHLEQVERLDA